MLMAGFDVFLKLDGIDGESTTKGHEKEIEVVSYDQSIDSTVGAALLEEVTLHFGKIRWEYRPIGPKGTGPPPIIGGWDVKANRKL
jgi:type VI protein secretion system component Hcp